MAEDPARDVPVGLVGGVLRARRRALPHAAVRGDRPRRALLRPSKLIAISQYKICDVELNRDPSHMTCPCPWRIFSKGKKK
jgi:hypothetical protein